MSNIKNGEVENTEEIKTFIKRHNILDDRYIGANFAPPIPEEGSLNENYTKMRTMGDQYLLKPSYAKYILNFRALWSPPEMLDDKGQLSQDYFQPPSPLPTNKLVDGVIKGIVEFGCHPKDYMKVYNKHVHKDYSPQSLDSIVHMLLGVIDTSPYYTYAFKNKKDIKQIRTKNLEKAEKENRLWGNLYWNVTYPPMPVHYMGPGGDFTELEPSDAEVNCKLRDEFVRLGWIKTKKSKKSSKKKNGDQETMEKFMKKKDK
eukprot:UN26813